MDFVFAQQQILRTGFGRDQSTSRLRVGYHRGDRGTAHMGDGGPRPGNGDERSGGSCGRELGFTTAPLDQDAVVGSSRCLQRLFGHCGDRLVLGMDQRRCAGVGDLAQRGEKIGRIEARDTMGRAGEDLEEGHTGSPQITDLVDTVRPRVCSKRVVDVRSSDEVRLLLLEIDDFSDGVAVGVFDDRGDTAGRGGRRPDGKSSRLRSPGSMR